MGLKELVAALACSVAYFTVSPREVYSLEKLTVPSSQSSLETKVNNFLGLKEEYKYNPQDLKKYQTWVKQGIEASKNGEIVLIVDKAAHEMDLYIKGKKKATYPVELGFNPYDDKTKEGDGCTPEGVYKVRIAREDNKLYHKDLYLDYPNKKNWKRFKKLKKNGGVSAEDRVGGDILIHGKGSGKGRKGVNWTAGCVALSNYDIDDLFERIYPIRNLKRIEVVIVKYGVRKSYLYKN